MPDGTNPWVVHRQSPVPVADPPTRMLQPTGPLNPQVGVPAPDQVDQLATIERSASAELWWVGTHGGAGEYSLAALVPQWAAAGHAWPRVRSQEQGLARVVLVARSNVRGLRAAQAAATQWAANLVPFVEVLGLVIVADAPGRLPKPLRDLAQVVSGGVPRTWNVPWIEAWRLGQQPAPGQAPREVRQLIDDLQELLRADADNRTTNTNREEQR